VAGLVLKDAEGIRPVASHVRWTFSRDHHRGRDIVHLGLKIPATMAVRAQRQIVIDEIEPPTPNQLEAGGPGTRLSFLRRAPLISGDKVAGVGVLFSEEPHFFDAEHLRLLSDLAADAALALERMEKQDLVEYLSFYDR